MAGLVSSGDCNKVPQIGVLNSKNLLSHCSGGWKSEIKVSAGLVASENHEGESTSCLSPGACRYITLISAFIFTWSFPCVCACVCVCVSMCI